MGGGVDLKYLSLKYYDNLERSCDVIILKKYHCREIAYTQPNKLYSLMRTQRISSMLEKLGVIKGLEVEI